MTFREPPKTPGIEDIKAALPVTWVLHLNGEKPAQAKASDVLYTVPWRLDSSPSLACYPSAVGSSFLDRWRDLARRDGGDVLDLIQRLYSVDFPEALERSRQMLSDFQDSDWEPPEPAAPKQDIDITAWGERYHQAESNLETVQDWLSDRDDQVSGLSAEWLFESFGVKWYDGALQVPYIDKDGLPWPGKRRPPGSKMLSLSGTSFTFLYGEHLLKPGPVILCEGETDVWTAAQRMPRLSALGLPTGAGSSPERFADRYLWTGRRVLIAFDNDEAGRSAAQRWGDWLLAQDAMVEILHLPSDKDLSEVADPSGLPSRPYQAPIPGLVASPKGYLSERTKAKDLVSDFVVTPLRVMRSPMGGASYEVSVGASPEPQNLLERDLSSAKHLSAWAHSRDRNWFGNERDLSTLRSILRSEASFVPQEEASDVVGLYLDHIVWPKGCFGEREIRYIPQGANVNIDIRIGDPAETASAARLLSLLLAFDDPEIVHPILAWSAVAPLRSRFDRFPILNISGASGSGKTTAAETLIPALTGSHSFQTLTSTTPHAVESVISTSNGFPVMFDEYRSGARPESLTRLEQIARDAYNKIPSRKGGGENWETIKEIRTEAPIVVIGEQSVVETSHVERMILVRVQRRDRSPENLSALEEIKTLISAESDLAAVYLHWLVQSRQPHRIPDPPAERIDYNLRILEYGWRLLSRFAQSIGQSLPEPSLAHVEEQAREAMTHNPLLEALQWAAGDAQAALNVWAQEQWVNVNVSGFLADVKRAGVFTLPGYTTTTIHKLLEETFGAHKSKAVNPQDRTQKQKRVRRFPRALLESDHDRPADSTPRSD